MAYSSQTIVSYNTSPPADDGSTTEANKVKWSTIKEKITDPVKNLAESINSANGAAWDDLASTTTDDGSKGFNLVHYPLKTGEAGVVNYQYYYDDVRRYGAVGDGATDDATFITNALAGAVVTGERVMNLIPGANHGISSGLTVGADSNFRVALQGHGGRNSQSRITALAGFTGEMVTVLTGSVDGFQVIGSDSTAVGHRGIVIGSVANTNPAAQVGNIVYGGGLYDFIYSVYEYDTSHFHDIQGTSEVGHAMMWLLTGASYSPAGSPIIERFHFNNTVTAPAAGDGKRYGIVIDRTDGLTLNGIVNNFDINVSLANGGGTPKNYSLGIEGLHTEDHRTAKGTDWAATTAKSLGDYVAPLKANANGHFYIVTTAGTTAGSEPTWPTTDGGTVVDGTVTWTEVGYSVAFDVGQNDRLNINRVWADDHLVVIRSSAANSTSVTNSRLTAQSAVYLQVSGQSWVDFDKTTIDGDIRLTGGSATTNYTASNSGVSNDSAAEVIDTTTGYYRNHSVADPIHETTTKTANYTVTDEDEIIFADATAGNIVITLPNSSTGKVFTVYKLDNTANTATVTAPYNYLETGIADHVLSNRGESVKTLMRIGTNPIKLNSV